MLDSLQFSIPLIVFSFAALGVFGVVFMASSKCREEQGH